MGCDPAMQYMIGLRAAIPAPNFTRRNATAETRSQSGKKTKMLGLAAPNCSPDQDRNWRIEFETTLAIRNHLLW